MYRVSRYSCATSTETIVHVPERPCEQMCQNVYSTKMFLPKFLFPKWHFPCLKSTPNSFLPESLWMMMAVGISKNGLRSIWDARVLSLRYDKVHRLPKQCEELKEEGLDTQVTPIIEFLIWKSSVLSSCTYSSLDIPRNPWIARVIATFDLAFQAF